MDAKELTTQLAGVANEIQSVEKAIREVEAGIKQAAAAGDQKEKDYLRKKEEQLRKKEEQLRKKEEQLRKKEEQLREEKTILLRQQVAQPGGANVERKLDQLVIQNTKMQEQIAQLKKPKLLGRSGRLSFWQSVAYVLGLDCLILSAKEPLTSSVTSPSSSAARASPKPSPITRGAGNVADLSPLIKKRQ